MSIIRKEERKKTAFSIKNKGCFCEKQKKEQGGLTGVFTEYIIDKMKART